MQLRSLMKSGHRPVAGMQFLAGHWPTYSVTSDLRFSVRYRGEGERSKVQRPGRPLTLSNHSIEQLEQFVSCRIEITGFGWGLMRAPC